MWIYLYESTTRPRTSKPQGSQAEDSEGERVLPREESTTLWSRRSSYKRVPQPQPQPQRVRGTIRARCGQLINQNLYLCAPTPPYHVKRTRCNYGHRARGGVARSTRRGAEGGQEDEVGGERCKMTTRVGRRRGVAPKSTVVHVAQLSLWTNGRDRQMDGWTDGRMDGWMDRWIGRQMDGMVEMDGQDSQNGKIPSPSPVDAHTVKAVEFDKLDSLRRGGGDVARGGAEGIRKRV